MMNTLVSPILSSLDTLRSRALRETMGIQIFRKIFLERSHRLLFLFSLATLFYFKLSITYPLVLLVLGPLFLGIPHLLASIRYSAHSLQNSANLKPRLLKNLVFLATILAVMQIAYGKFFLENPTFSKIFSHLPNLVELLGFFLVIFFIFRTSLKSKWFGALLGSGLLASSLSSPRFTLGALLFIHNAVAYASWHQLAQKNEKWVPLICAAVFAFITVFILSGYADPLFSWNTLSTLIPGSTLSLESASKIILPSLKNDLGMVRLAIAFAFGQSLHYFVWLKAIPDQCHISQVPTTFTQSWRLLKNECTPTVVTMVTVTALVLISLTLAGQGELARNFYFALAGFHGYLELSSLAVKVA